MVSQLADDDGSTGREQVRTISVFAREIARFNKGVDEGQTSVNGRSPVGTGIFEAGEFLMVNHAVRIKMPRVLGCECVNSTLSRDSEEFS